MNALRCCSGVGQGRIDPADVTVAPPIYNVDAPVARVAEHNRAGFPQIKLHDRIPNEMRAIRDLTLSALWRSPEHWEMNPDPT